MDDNKITYYKLLAQDYTNAATIIKGCNAAVVVEAEDDVIFWNKIFTHFLSGYSFDFISNSKTPKGDVASGCTNCLRYHQLGCLSKEFFICIDSDYRYLLQEKYIDVEHFVFQTYTYSFENHYCYPKNIENTFGKSGLNNNLFDFEAFLKAYSQSLYELFICHLISISKADGIFGTDDFNLFVDINVTNLNEAQLISDLQTSVKEKFSELKKIYITAEIKDMEDKCNALGLNKDNAFFYFRGHNVFDRVVLRIMKAVQRKLEEIASQNYSGEEKREFFPRNAKNIEECLIEDIHFNRYPEIRKIEKDIKLYSNI
jgi:hypothetical protein